MSDRLLRLHSEHGQSPWLDNLKRSLLDDGSLATLRDGGVRGLTSNPTIFQKAIQGSQDYDEQFRELVAAGSSVIDCYWQLVLADIRRAADVFGSVYASSGGGDGFVSVEVDPNLAHDTDATLKTQPVGTGPFKLQTKGAKETTADTVLVANPVYWRSTAKNPLPKAEQVTFRILGDSAAKVAAVRTNAVDNALFGGSGQSRSAEGPRLSSVHVTGSSEGAPVPRVYGRARLSGQVIWATEFEEVVETQEQSSGRDWCTPGRRASSCW